MTNRIKKFIQKHNVRPLFFIAIYAWMFAACVLGEAYTPWAALPCVFLSGVNFIILLLVAEND